VQWFTQRARYGREWVGIAARENSNEARGDHRRSCDRVAQGASARTSVSAHGELDRAREWLSDHGGHLSRAHTPGETPATATSPRAGSATARRSDPLSSTRPRGLSTRHDVTGPIRRAARQSILVFGRRLCPVALQLLGHQRLVRTAFEVGAQLLLALATERDDQLGSTVAEIGRAGNALSKCHCSTVRTSGFGRRVRVRALRLRVVSSPLNHRLFDLAARHPVCVSPPRP
jgi:hypothetical protein